MRGVPRQPLRTNLEAPEAWSGAAARPPTRGETAAVLLIAAITCCWTLAAHGPSVPSAVVVASFATAALSTWQAHRRKPLTTPPIVVGYVLVAFLLMLQVHNTHFGQDAVSGLVIWPTLVCPSLW